MREELERRQVHQAIDSTLSGLKGDPWLFRRISAETGKGDRKVKRKLSAGLVLAIVLALLATGRLPQGMVKAEDFGDGALKTLAQALLEGKRPLTIGGGIGQSRICMLILKKCHIGEVQVSHWDERTLEVCRKNGVFLL